MKIESYSHGSPCWVCLGTTDTDAARRFYAELFGWEYAEAEMFPGMADSPVVFNASKGGDLAGAIAPHLGKPGSPASWAFNFSVDDLAAEQETPDHWIVYFHVDDVDATVELATARGGTTIMAPDQFADIGRIAVVADPQGAVLGLITPGDGPQP